MAPTSNNPLPADLDDLMRGARRRVLHLVAIVAAILAAISSHISMPSPIDARSIVNVSVWGLGCFVILALGMVWYASRAAATRRLPRLLETGIARISSVEVTHVALEIAPFGCELDLVLESGEHLAFGYWTGRSAYRLLEIVSERLAVVEHERTIHE